MAAEDFIIGGLLATDDETKKKDVALVAATITVREEMKKANKIAEQTAKEAALANEQTKRAAREAARAAEEQAEYAKKQADIAERQAREDDRERDFRRAVEKDRIRKAEREQQVQDLEKIKKMGLKISSHELRDLEDYCLKFQYSLEEGCPIYNEQKALFDSFDWGDTKERLTDFHEGFYTKFFESRDFPKKKDLLEDYQNYSENQQRSMKRCRRSNLVPLMKDALMSGDVVKYLNDIKDGLTALYDARQNHEQHKAAQLEKQKLSVEAWQKQKVENLAKQAQAETEEKERKEKERKEHYASLVFTRGEAIAANILAVLFLASVVGVHIYFSNWFVTLLISFIVLAPTFGSISAWLADILRKGESK